MTIRDRVRLRRRHGAGGPQRRLFVRYLTVLVGLVGSALLVTSLVALYFTYRDTEGAVGDALELTASQHARALSDAGFVMGVDVDDAVPRTPGGRPPLLPARRTAYERVIGRF